MEGTWEVIVVGGRVAGATLAARLGQQGIHTLLLERATLPSLPAASAPAIYAGALAMLDEIGAAEAEYARGTPRIRRWVTEAGTAWRSDNPVPLHQGRDYGYAVDRGRFDAALWQRALEFPTVEGRQGTIVTALLREGEQVCGVVVRGPDGAPAPLRARLVVGADGRFSAVARKVGALSHTERRDLPTSLLYAYWQGADPYDGGAATVHVVAPGNGLGFLLMDSADGSVAAVIEGRAALLEADGAPVESFYDALLRAQPQVWRRLQPGERRTPVRGMKRVGNLYRQGGGPGWALVGDALHQKDPIDGQGIYDALFSAKALGGAITAWLRGGQPWPTAQAEFEALVRLETFPMYLATLQRIQRDLYTDYPEWAWRSWIRWLATDPHYLHAVGRLIVRASDPSHWLPPSLLLRALLLGPWRDLRARAARRG